MTGAAQGLGRSSALYLAREGASIVAIDRQSVAETIDAVNAAGGVCVGVTADVAIAHEVDDAFAEVIGRFGRIDVLINGAALFTTLDQRSFLDIEPDEWDRVFAVNTKSVFLCSKAAAKQMIRQSSGSIINIASNVFSYGMANFLYYVASKAAVVGITRGVARELGPYGIRVNAVSPGLVSTEVISGTRSRDYIDGVVSTQCIAKPIMPDDIAAVLTFLSGDSSHLITGQTLLVNGGSHMGPA
ncbi:MAG: SDR family oxidoreductase [Antricoccus sp.]